MKSLARGLVWWPGIDRQIEETVKQCEKCQQSRSSPPPAPLHPWSWPTRPWTRLHMDYAGPKEGRMFLVIIDAHSKWLEVIPMKTATALTTVQQLRTVFARFGVPESVVTDNGPQVVGREFEQFCNRNGIRHVKVAPYHPASNGLAERAVRTFKQGFQKYAEGTVEDRIARFLLHYRMIPHSTTGTSPAQLLFGRQLQTRLDSLNLAWSSMWRAACPSRRRIMTRRQWNDVSRRGRRCMSRTCKVDRGGYLAVLRKSQVPCLFK